MRPQFAKRGSDYRRSIKHIGKPDAHLIDNTVTPEERSSRRLQGRLSSNTIAKGHDVEASRLVRRYPKGYFGVTKS